LDRRDKQVFIQLGIGRPLVGDLKVLKIYVEKKVKKILKNVYALTKPSSTKLHLEKFILLRPTL